LENEHSAIPIRCTCWPSIPRFRNTGYAMLVGDAGKPAAFDVISIPMALRPSAAPAAVRTHSANVIRKFQPDEVAVEGIVPMQSHLTAKIQVP
jgi:crossover junction endodeoxyribonuclease RuvC